MPHETIILQHIKPITIVMVPRHDTVEKIMPLDGAVQRHATLSLGR